MPRPLLIELFRGTGSVGTQAARRGWDVVSVDNDATHGATHTVDVLRLPYKEMAVPDFVWASPPCTTFSYAAVWVHHREPGTGRALSRDAHDADRVVVRTLEMIRYWAERNPDLKFCIENPRGYLRHMPYMQGLRRASTQYGFYDWPVRKATDFWTNFELVLKSDGPTPASQIRVGKDPGWVRALRDAVGAPEDEPSAVTLGRIPPALVRSILGQMERARDQNAPRAAPVRSKARSRRRWPRRSRSPRRPSPTSSPSR